MKFAHARRDVRRHKRRTTNALPKLNEVHDAADEILNSVRGLTSNLCRVGLEILDDKTRVVVNALNVIQHQVLDLQKGNREVESKHFQVTKSKFGFSLFQLNSIFMTKS